MRIISQTYNPFAENTLLLVGEEKSCIIVDPGMMDQGEADHFFQCIEEEGLSPTRLIVTHGHIDHILGLKSVYERYGLIAEMHRDSLALMESTPQIAQMYGIPYFPGPDPKNFLDVSDKILLDGQELELRFVPGHAPGHLIIVDHDGKQIVAGDTLFRESIGRTDLPGGDHALLLEKIRSEMFSLPNDYVVWPGHGPNTSIGHEKNYNPFL